MVLACLGPTGCADDLCASQVPAFQIDLTLHDDVDRSSLAHLWVEARAAGKQRRTALDVGPLKASGSASFAVVVGDAGEGGFVAEATVLATDATNQILARGHESFTASGDACNYFSITLAKPQSQDGGP